MKSEEPIQPDVPASNPVIKLRSEFELLAARLNPETEPAVTFQIPSDQEAGE